MEQILLCRGGPIPVHRKTLLQTLADELPPDTIRFSSKLISVESQAEHRCPISVLRLEDSTIIKAKVSDILSNQNRVGLNPSHVVRPNFFFHLSSSRSNLGVDRVRWGLLGDREDAEARPTGRFGPIRGTWPFRLSRGPRSESSPPSIRGCVQEGRHGSDQ